jgi:HK97 family phage prohead protease
MEEQKRPAHSGTERRYLEQKIIMDYRDQSTPVIAGYAAVFDTETRLWSDYSERVAPGAFTKTIAKDDIRALWNHDPNFVLGRNKSGTLRLWEDEHGLAYEIIAPDTSWSKDLQTLIKRGDISQGSFGFNILKQSREIDEEKREITVTLEEVKLFDVSPVTYPAYPTTEVHVRTEGSKKTYFFGDGESLTLGSEVEEKKIVTPEPEDDTQLFAEIDKYRQLTRR